MNASDYGRTGWSLHDGEQLRHDSPATFTIPEIAVRKALQAGDFAKLVFRIDVDEGEQVIERMWVLVRSHNENAYSGVLDNEPTLIEPNHNLCRGTEVTFEPRHVIDYIPGARPPQVIQKHHAAAATSLLDASTASVHPLEATSD